ncbi:DUF1289 domain-containing protein [Roseospira visakhapatnamensis]|uniref:DUF1289 domain-containing protein n=1 Tax=Roseospira visakhapatnamensis TaxID=390880 RepID=A0A7W6RCP5_9PROT|nr:DUF1289 domain-containing protein [Roseospira visakhapatnamensis]MBB4266002.1 hypothetical protein [Roseospira visakhapatnamensis]
MADLASTDTNDVPSPCVDICTLDDARVYCVGCGRHIDEIRTWRRMTADDKRAVWARLRQDAAEAG